MKAWGLVAVAVFLAGWVLPVRADDLKDGLKPEQLYKKVLPSVMTLTVQKADGTAATGTGFLAVKEGLAVTAWHVVKDTKSATAKFSDGEEFEVSGLVDKDEKRDVALVRVKEFGRPLLALATVVPEVGTKAYAVGAPEGLDFSLSDGLVSQIQNGGGVTLYQFSCPASPGNSGGPLVNAGGEVIGVVSRQMRDGQNLNFAMPAAYALALDATLPTRTWESVKPDEPGGGLGGEIKPNDSAQAVTQGDAALDKRLVDCFVTLSDALTALQVADGLLRKDGGTGFTAGVPPFVYSLQRALVSEGADLQLARSADPAREQARVEVAGRVAAANDSLDLLVQAVRAAQGGGGWYGAPNDLIAQSMARLPEFTSPYSAVVKALALSAGFQVLLPKTGVMGLSEDTTGFRLGVASWVRSPLDLTDVAKNFPADKMGLRAGDTLLSVGGQEPKSLLDLKAVIKGNPGGRLKIVVTRDGKRKEWEASIPRELP